MPREPGTPGRRASEGEGGDGARPEAAGPRAAHGGEDAELGRAWAVLGRRPHSRAARVLSRVRRPRPALARPVAAAPSRSRPAAQAGSEAAVRRAVRPSGTASAPCLPAAVPLAAAAAPSPPGLLLRSSRARAEDRGCVARRRATFQSSGRRTGEGRRGRREKKRRRTRAGLGWREFLPQRPRRQQRHRPGG